MRVKYTKEFKKNYKKYIQNNTELDALLTEYTGLLNKGRSLPAQSRDHQLRHQIKGVRDFHLSGDMVTVYYLVRADNTIEYINIGPHSKVFKHSKTIGNRKI